RKKALIALALVTLIWGGATPVIKLGLNSLPTFTFLFIRLAISSIAVLPILLVKLKKTPLKLPQIPALFFIPFFGQTISLGLVFLALDRTSALDGAILGSISPIMISIAGVILLHEVITKREKIGTAIALLGTLIIIFQPWAESGFSLHDGFREKLLGNVLMVGYLLANTAYTIATKRYFKKYPKTDPFIKISLGFIVGAITFFPLSMLELSSLTTVSGIAALTFPPLTAILSLLYMAIFSGVIAYFLYEMALKYIEASEASVFTYLQPVIAIPASFILLGEVPTGVFMMGGAVIAMGVYLAETKKFPYFPASFKRSFKDLTPLITCFFSIFLTILAFRSS
ncbi:MAG: DMT family transporter, partial [Patescibacteria group bacterium]